MARTYASVSGLPSSALYLVPFMRCGSCIAGCRRKSSGDPVDIAVSLRHDNSTGVRACTLANGSPQTLAMDHTKATQYFLGAVLRRRKATARRTTEPVLKSCTFNKLVSLDISAIEQNL